MKTRIITGPLFGIFFFSVISLGLYAQTGGDAKAKQLEEMRKIKQQMIEDQKTIQQQNEWNNQSSQQEIKKLNQENQQKNFEIASSKQEASKAKQDMVKAKSELASKQAELAHTQMLIDSAKMQLASTQGLLMQSEMIRKRTEEALQHQEDSVKMLQQAQTLSQLQLDKQTAELEGQRQRSKFLITAAVLGISLFLLVAALLVYRQKTITELGNKNKIIQEEKRRSDELLLNILPEEVMHELKAQIG